MRHKTRSEKYNKYKTHDKYNITSPEGPPMLEHGGQLPIEKKKIHTNHAYRPKYNNNNKYKVIHYRRTVMCVSFSEDSLIGRIGSIVVFTPCRDRGQK